MNAEAFRKIALSFPGSAEGGHMEHADFRRVGKVYATLGYPDQTWGMIKLAPEEQGALVSAKPDIFRAATGAWGRSGSTLVRLASARAADVRKAMELAWSRAEPIARKVRKPPRP